MAQINDKFFSDLEKGATWAAGVAFQRSNPLPLDKYSVFPSLDELNTYATTNAVAYPGQIVAVVNNGIMEVYVLAEALNDEQVYILQPQELGAKIDVDESSIAFNNETGLLEIYGFKSADGLTLPQKQSDGTIKWVGIDAIVEGDGNTTYKFSVKNDDEHTLVITPVNEGADGESQEVTFSFLTNEEIEDELKGYVDVKTYSTDKATLEAAISTAKTEAINEAVATIIGETGIDEKYDTLKEVADWILSDSTNSAELVALVNKINDDYLVSADKTELQTSIDELEELVGILPDDATSTTVVAYIQEVVDGLKIGDYAKASDLTALAERITNLEKQIITVAGLDDLQNYSDIGTVAYVNQTQKLYTRTMDFWQCIENETIVVTNSQNDTITYSTVVPKQLTFFEGETLNLSEPVQLILPEPITVPSAVVTVINNSSKNITIATKNDDGMLYYEDIYTKSIATVTSQLADDGESWVWDITAQQILSDVDKAYVDEGFIYFEEVIANIGDGDVMSPDSATEDNIAVFGSNKTQLKDSGKKLSDFVTKEEFEAVDVMEFQGTISSTILDTVPSEKQWDVGWTWIVETSNETFGDLGSVEVGDMILAYAKHPDAAITSSVLKDYFTIVQTNLDPSVFATKEDLESAVSDLTDGITTAQNTANSANTTATKLNSALNNSIDTTRTDAMLSAHYIWYADTDKVFINKDSINLIADGTISDFKQRGNVFIVLNSDLLNNDGTVAVKDNVLGDDLTLFNHGDLLLYTGVSGMSWIRFPMHDAKTNLMGLMSPWDKTQVNKVPTIETTANNALSTAKTRLPVFSSPNPTDGWQVNWLFDDGWYTGGLKKDCGGHPPVLNENHTSWAILVLNGMATDATSLNHNHRLQVAYDLVNSKVYMRRGWMSDNSWYDSWTDISQIADGTITKSKLSTDVLQGMTEIIDCAVDSDEATYTFSGNYKEVIFNNVGKGDTAYFVFPENIPTKMIEN